MEGGGVPDDVIRLAGAVIGPVRKITTTTTDPNELPVNRRCAAAVAGKVTVLNTNPRKPMLEKLGRCCWNTTYLIWRSGILAPLIK
jgi:hypothetical protein